MKQETSGLFPFEDEYAYIMLVWGSRAEKPAEVAARSWATMRALKDAVPTIDSRYPDPVWAETNPAWDGDTPGGSGRNYMVAAPSSLEALRERTQQKPGIDESGVFEDAVGMSAYLALGDPDGPTIGSYSASMGDAYTYLGNTAVIRFMPTYPLGNQQEASQLFRTLVRIWQPDWARFGALRTSQQVEGYAKSYAGYLIWIADAALGSPPALESATADPFGDGTLLTVTDWSIEGVRSLHQELLATRAPEPVVKDPAQRQVVPQFPSSDSQRRPSSGSAGAARSSRRVRTGETSMTTIRRDGLIG